MSVIKPIGLPPLIRFAQNLIDSGLTNDSNIYLLTISRDGQTVELRLELKSLKPLVPGRTLSCHFEQTGVYSSVRDWELEIQMVNGVAMGAVLSHSGGKERFEAERPKSITQTFRAIQPQG